MGTVAEAGVLSERDPVFEVVLNQPLSAKSWKEAAEDDGAAADVEVSLSLFEDEQIQGSEGSAWCDGGRCVVCVNGSGRIDLSSDCLSLRVGDTVKVACQGPLHVSGALGTIASIAGGERAKVKLLQCRHQLMWGKCAECFPGIQAGWATTSGSFGSASQAGTGGGFGAFGAAGTGGGFGAKPAGAFGAATGAAFGASTCAAFGAPQPGGFGGGFGGAFGAKPAATGGALGSALGAFGTTAGAFCGGGAFGSGGLGAPAAGSFGRPQTFGQAKPTAFGAPTETFGAAASVIELRVSDLYRVSASSKSVSQAGDRLAIAVSRPWNGKDIELAILVNGEVVERMQYVPSGVRNACVVQSSSTAVERFFDSYAFLSLGTPSSASVATPGAFGGAPDVTTLSSEVQARNSGLDVEAMSILCTHLALLDGKVLSESEAKNAAEFYLKVLWALVSH
jgi:hypothetical protein